MISPIGSQMRAQDHARGFSQTARAASIRYGTVFGIVIAFTLLCIVSARANPTPEVNASAHTPLADIQHPVAALIARDAVVSRAQPSGDPYFLGKDVGADTSNAPPPGESSVPQSRIDGGTDHPAIAWYGLVAVLLALMVLTVIALGGWCRARGLLKRTAEMTRGVESEWQRRYAVVEAREQAARAVGAAQVAAAVTQERNRIQAAMRHLVSAPLSALSDLLSAFNGASLPSAQRPLVGRIQSAVQTCVRALEDMLAPSSVESRAIALDESLTDLRELIDGVVALFSPAAAQKGLHMSVSIDRSVATRILADGARLGQVVFHLLSRAIQAAEHGQITIVVRAEPINAGSQRIFISVRDVRSEGAASVRPIQTQLPWHVDTGEPIAESRDESDSSFALCQQLAHYMHGELTVGNEPGFGKCSTFIAPFAIENVHPSVAPVHSNDLPLQQAAAAHPADSSAGTSTESFDRSYLDALSNEGIDLPTFVRGWRHAILDDLQQMRSLSKRHDVGGLRALLHRLSGAVELVGAHSLTEALRRTSVAQSEPEVGALDALAKRVEALMIQLDQAIDPHRSNP